MVNSSQAKREKHNLGRLLRSNIQKVTPVDKGGLKGSINYNLTAEGVQVGASAKYASFVESGTRDHFVKPLHARALAWVDGGETFFSKGHKVSGIKKREYLLKGASIVLGRSKIVKVG